MPFSSQDLALEARDIWLEWNRSIRESDPANLPKPLTPEDELLTNAVFISSQMDLK